MIIDDNSKLEKIGSQTTGEKVELERTRSDRPGMEPEQARGEKGDRVELSSEAVTLKNLEKITDDIPEVRADKVAEIREQIENGTYEISTRGIAEKLIDEGLGLLE